MDKNNSISQAEKKIRNAKGNCRSLKAEIRIVADPNESHQYKKELSSFEQTLAQLTTDIQSLKQREKRNALFLDANTDGNVSPDNNDPFKSGDKLLDGADKIQDKTQQSLFNTANMIAESKQTGMMTLEELERQRNQLDNTGQNINRMEDNLKTSDKLIKTFGKRMATDKLIQAFTCLNILLIVGVVIYSVVKGGLPGNTENVPESPVGNSNGGTRLLRGP